MRARPQSTDRRTPSTVIDDSATFVDRMTLRRPGSGRTARVCSSSVGFQCSRIASSAVPGACAERLLRAPDLAGAQEEDEHVPRALEHRRRRTAPVTCFVERPVVRGWAGARSRSGEGGPRMHFAHRPASSARGTRRAAPQGVADIPHTRRSGRAPSCSRRSSARPRSVAPVALVELVEHDSADAQARSESEPARQHPSGVIEAQPRARRRLVLEAHRVPDGLAHALAELCARRNRRPGAPAAAVARGSDLARDTTPASSSARYARRLSGARRRLDEGAASLHRRDDVREHRVDGQGELFFRRHGEEAEVCEGQALRAANADWDQEGPTV